MLKVEKTMKYTMPVFGYFIGSESDQPAGTGKKPAGIIAKARRLPALHRKK